jgi:hypothetical protein
MDTVTTKKVGKVLDPSSKFSSSHTRWVIIRILEDAEDLGGENLGDRPCHARESVHEKVDGIPAEEVERRAGALSRVCPWIVVVEHVDEHNAQGPDIGGAGSIGGRNVVSALVAHVWSTSTIHVRGFEVLGGEAEIGQFDNNLAFQTSVRRGERAISDDKVFWLDVAVEDLLSMTGGHSVTHLTKHGSDKTETGAR